MAETRADILRYAGSDLLCYRAEEPDTLVARPALLALAIARGFLTRLTLGEFQLLPVVCATPASASLKPDKRFGFDLQCQLHTRAGASLQFPEGTAPRVRPDLLAARNALRPLRRLRSSRAGAMARSGPT
jgi:hypothetical protein